MNAISFKDLRRRMVDSQLRTNGVTDSAVLFAMAEVPREHFVPDALAASCYRDTLVPLGGGRALNPPSATGRMLDAARVARGDRVLLVGAATGYVAALLAQMGAVVVAVEEDETLLARARTVLADVAGVELVTARFAEGAPGRAPFDLLLVDGAIEALPDALVAQLVEDGRLVGAIADRGMTRLVEGRRAGASCALLPFAETEVARLPGFAPAPAFSF